MEQLIKISSDHYVIIGDSEIKKGDLCYDPLGSPGWKNIKGVVECLRTHPTSYWNKHSKKITHSTKPLEGVEPLSLSEVKGLIGEPDVESLARKRHYDGTLEGGYLVGGFINGYMQSLENNKDKNYTEEDIRVAIRLATTSKYDHILMFYSEEEIIEFINQPKTSWDVEFVDGKIKLK